MFQMVDASSFIPRRDLRALLGCDRHARSVLGALAAHDLGAAHRARERGRVREHLPALVAGARLDQLLEVGDRVA